MSDESRHRAAKVYRFEANPGVDRKERDRAVKIGPHSGLGTWAGARVAPLRCPILRPGEIGCNVWESVQQPAIDFFSGPVVSHFHRAAKCCRAFFQ